MQVCYQTLGFIFRRILTRATRVQAFVGADALFLVTTFQGAAAEIQHGKNAVDAAKEVCSKTYLVKCNSPFRHRIVQCLLVSHLLRLCTCGATSPADSTAGEFS